MRLVLCCISSMVFFTMGIAQSPLRVMTFNIRFDTPRDSPNHWQARKEKVASQILYNEADIVGIQEALHRQVTYLQQALPGYQFAGVGRDDGKEAGEYSGIFYNSNRLLFMDSKTFWLSLTPEEPGSKSWDAAITRIVTWAKFKDKKTGKIFYHFNTHFDHMGQEARRQSAKMLLERVKSIAGETPAIVTGDFNATPSDEPISIITDVTNPNHLQDTKALSTSGHYGPSGTFNAFGPKETDDQPIDYIFNKGKWKVMKHATLSETWGGLFASDHFAVLAVLKL